MQKVPGVENVHVSLKDGLTSIDLESDNTVTVARLRQIIKNNGFVSKDVRVLAAGTPKPAGGRPGFEISRTNEVVHTRSDPQRAGDLWQFTVPNDAK